MNDHLYARLVGPTVEAVAFQKALHLKYRWHSHYEFPPHLYTILPFSMVDLPGTTWRNAHTASLLTVKCVAEGRGGEIGPDPDDLMFSLGLWRDVGFCIEHWVRVDDLPAADQIAWAKERMAKCRAKAQTARAKLLKVKRKGYSTTFLKDQGQYTVQAVEEAREELASLCVALGVIEMDILNAGIQVGEQLSLF